jgi:PKHD-type hydroxylase
MREKVSGLMLWPEPFHYAEKRALFTAEECAAIIEFADEGMMTSGHLDGARECGLFWLYETVNTEWVFACVEHMVAGWNVRYGFDLGAFSSGYQLACYRPGERYDWHMDLGHGDMSLRKISVAVELSNPLEHGAGLEVWYGEGRDNNLHLARGEAAIMPSWVMHRALPPQPGSERWSLAAWFCGKEPFR